MIPKTPLLCAVLAFASAACATAQTLGVPNTANAPPSGSPVQIEDCQAGQEGGLLLAKSDGNFEVTFTNEGAVTADLIRFQIELGQEQLFIRDVGKFSPGVTIKHTFRRRGGNVVSSPLFSPVSLHCAVAAVHFVDGTDWTASAAAASSAGAAAPALLGDGYLGVEMKQQADGVYVALVLPAGPAANAGIHQGDRIVRIAGNNVSTIAEAVQLISAAPPGIKLQMTVMRQGTSVDLAAIVGKRPAQTAQ